MQDAAAPQVSIEALMAQIEDLKRKNRALDDQVFQLTTDLRAQKELNLSLAAQLSLSAPSPEGEFQDDSAPVQALLTHGRLQGIAVGLRYRSEPGMTAEQVLEKAQSLGYFTRHTAGFPRRTGTVCRYRLHSFRNRPDAIADPNGELVSFLDYDALKNSHTFLLHQYQSLCAALSDRSHTKIKDFTPTLRLADGRKAPVVKVPRTPGKICFFYGRLEGEVGHFISFGDDVPRCDRALVTNQFNSRPMEWNYIDNRPKFGQPFLDELHARGYDIRTLRFSIERIKN
jgi:hypothetical protein